MATSTIAVTQGSGKNIATHSFTEDAVTKELQRVVLTNSSGTELGTTTDPLPFTAQNEILATVSGTATGTGIVGSVQDVGAKSFSIQLTGTFDATIQVQQSNDNSTWVATGMYDITGAVASASGGIYTGVTATGISVGHIHARYVRVFCSAYTSGSAVITCLLYGIPTPTIRSTVNVTGVRTPNGDSAMDDTNDALKTVPNGNVAHNAADSGNPIKIGYIGYDDLSTITLVDDNDRVQSVAGLDGVQVVRPNTVLGDIVSGNASNTDGSSTQVIAAQSAGVKTYITDVTITNTSASNIYVELKDGTTAKWTFPVPANGGVTHNFATPIGGTAATAWNFDPSAAATTIYCSVAGFKSKI